MRLISRLIVGIVPVLAATAFPNAARAGLFVDKEHHFEIRLARGWQRSTAAGQSGVTSFTAPKSPTDQHAAATLTVVVAEGNISPVETLGSFEKAFLGSLGGKYKNLAILNRGEIRVGKLSARWNDYEVGEGVEKFRSLTYLLLNHSTRGSVAYALTFSSLPSQFERQRKGFEKMVRTFRIRRDR